MSRLRFRTFIINVALVCISVIVAILIAEAFLRLFLPQELSAVANIYKEDSALKYVYRPNTTMRHRTKDFDVEITTNSWGFRDKEYSASKPAGVCRILLVGDSFSVGQGVSQEANFEHILESSLNSAISETNNSRWEVINTAVSGYHLSQYVTSIERYAAEFEVDAVLLGLFIGNDLGRGPSSSARMVVEDGYLMGYDSGADKSDNSRSFRMKIRRAFKSVRRFVATSSHLAILIRNSTYPLLYKLKLVAPPYFAKLENYAVDGSIQDLQVYGETKKLLEEVSAYSAETGVSIFVLLIPQRHQVYADLWQQTVVEAKIQPDDVSFDTPNNWLTAEFDRLDFKYVDVLDAMRASQDQEFYFEHDSHWNELGHQVSGKALAETFRSLDNTVCAVRQ